MTPNFRWDEIETLKERHDAAHGYRMWCKTNLKIGALVRVHFPNPKHSGHPLHNELAEVVEYASDAVVCIKFLDPSVGHERYMHVFEFRPIHPLEALARA